MKKAKVIVLTTLPFKIQGNQSLKRFIELLLKNDFEVDIYSSVNRSNNNYCLKYKKLYQHKIISIKCARRVCQKFRKKNKASNYYLNINSYNIIPPYGQYNLTTISKKWLLFLIQIMNNLLLFVYLVLFQSKKIKDSNLVIAYECGYTLCAKMLSTFFKKRYINKFQGTVALESTGRDILKCILYYPHFYFGINKSDLCIMVNDGTDGKYYAKARGNKNILFEPHGVGNEEYKLDQEKENYLLKKYIDPYINKFILFNNASNSRLKRVDRVIRAMKHIDPKILKNIILLTTYHADDKNELINYTKQLKLDNYVFFLDNIDSLTSSFLIKKSNALIMTNDISNLGNPVLEAVYYGTPIISINDGSLDGFLTNKKDSTLINLDENFDQNLANAITKLATDSKYHQYLKDNINKNVSIHSLKFQQKKELKTIISTI